MPEIRHLGHITEKDERRPGQEKIRAITEMPQLKDVVQLRSFLGLVNYYGVFIKEIRQLRAPLDDLLKKNTPCKSSPNYHDAKKSQMSAGFTATAHTFRYEILTYSCGRCLRLRY